MRNSSGGARLQNIVQYQFTVEQLLQLINYVRQLRLLRSLKDPLYHDCNKKTLAWGLIEKKTGIPDILRWKWDLLQAGWRAEKRTQTKDFKSGNPGLTKLGKPRKIFDYWKAMEFLEDRRTSKETYSNLEEFILSDEFPTDDSSNTPSVKSLVDPGSVENPIVVISELENNIDSMPVYVSPEDLSLNGNWSAVNGVETFPSGGNVNHERPDGTSHEEFDNLSNTEATPSKASSSEQDLKLASSVLKSEDIKVSPWMRNTSSSQQVPTACYSGDTNNNRKKNKVELSARIADFTESLISTLDKTKEVPIKLEESDQIEPTATTNSRRCQT